MISGLVSPLNRAHPACWQTHLLRAAACFSMLLCGPSHAGLGETASSVSRDQLSLKGSTIQVTSQDKFSRYEFTTPSGVRIREFVSASGKVFAVAWLGPDMPDLSVLLAGFHKDYLEAAEKPRINQRALIVNNERLVLHINALPRGFMGGAHLPSELPADVLPQQLR